MIAQTESLARHVHQGIRRMAGRLLVYRSLVRLISGLMEQGAQIVLLTVVPA